jgi:hypothetical protein
MSAFADLVRFVPTAGGTTDWTYSSAVGGCQSPAAANVQNGVSYKVYAVSSDLTQWEISQGVCNSGTWTFPRTTVLSNSSGTGSSPGQTGAGTKINFATVPQVSIIALAEDLISVEVANSFTAAQQLQAANNILVPSSAGVQALTTAQQLQARQNIGAGGRIQMLTITRSMSAGAGNVSYTGLPFKPRALIATGGINGTSGYIIYSGMAESTTPASGSNAGYATSGGAVSANFLQLFSTTATNGQYAQVASYDSGGFTLSWGILGTPPAGSATFYIMCFE